MGTKANPAACDCYAKAEPDEPMFILLGRDRHAPTLVWLWSVLRELDGEPKEVTDEARECIVQMIKWASDHNRQVVGLGQAVMAGVLELIRGANYGVKNDGTPKNSQTLADDLRKFLAETRFDLPKESSAEAK